MKTNKQNTKGFKSKLSLFYVYIFDKYVQGKSFLSDIYIYTELYSRQKLLFWIIALWIRFDADSSDKHQLFFKEHSVRNQEPEYPRNKTLFVLNVPPYASTDCLKHAFIELCGDVHFITFSKAKGFKVAYIVFKKESSLDKVMELSEDCVITLNSDENMCLTGLRSKLYFFLYCKRAIYISYNSSNYFFNFSNRMV